MRRLSILTLVLLCATAPAARAWTWPVEGTVLRPFVFGADPYAAGLHRGVDISGASGSTVRAPAAGRVSFSGTVPTGGEALTVETPDGLSVTLVHLGSRLAAEGAVVGEGETVGTVGPTGTPEGDEPYVHLGVRVTSLSEGYLDPLSLLPPRLEPEPAPQAPAARVAEPVPAPAAPAGSSVAVPAPQPVAGVASPAPEPAPPVVTAAVPAAVPAPVPAPEPRTEPAPATAPVAVPAALPVPAPVAIASEPDAGSPAPEPPGPARVDVAPAASSAPAEGDVYPAAPPAPAQVGAADSHPAATAPEVSAAPAASPRGADSVAGDPRPAASGAAAEERPASPPLASLAPGNEAAAAEPAPVASESATLADGTPPTTMAGVVGADASARAGQPLRRSRALLAVSARITSANEVRQSGRPAARARVASGLGRETTVAPGAAEPAVSRGRSPLMPGAAPRPAEGKSSDRPVSGARSTAVEAESRRFGRRVRPPESRRAG